jgi:hypothetical protein
VANGNGLCGSDVDVETRAYWGLPEKGRPVCFSRNSEKCLILAGFLRLSQSKKSTGHQDHTTSPSAAQRHSSFDVARIHRIPSHVRDDRETPLLGDGTASDVLLFRAGGEAENFCKRDWTGQISLNCLGKFDFWRRRNVGDRIADQGVMSAEALNENEPEAKAGP